MLKSPIWRGKCKSYRKKDALGLLKNAKMIKLKDIINISPNLLKNNKTFLGAY